MAIFEFVSKFSPIVLFCVICLNALIWWFRGKPVRRAFPERKRSYIRILGWFVGYTALICFFGQLEFSIGSQISIFEFLKFRSIEIYGKIAGALIFSLSPLLAIYIYGFGGADELARHPGLLSRGTTAIPERAIWMMMPVLVFTAHAAFVLQIMNLAS